VVHDPAFDGHRLPELSVLPQAVAADGDEMAVVDEPIDERGGHDIVAEDLAPLFAARIGREHRVTSHRLE
jgi:hypothetical protein